MLKKLYYYEARYYTKIVVPALIALFAATAVMFFGVQLISSKNEIFNLIGIFLFAPYALFIVAMFTLPTVIITMRFYKQFFTLQGYMTFTLPVKPMEHFFCKFIMAIVVSFVMVFFNLLSPIILLASMQDGLLMMQTIVDVIFAEISLFHLLVILFTYSVQGVFLILILYTAMCLGQLGARKILTSIGAWIALNYGSQIVAFVVSVPLSLIFYALNPETLSSNMNMDYVMWVFGLISFVFLLESIAAIFVCKHIITKKLNLE